MLKLKLQYFGHLMRRAESFEKTLKLRKIEDRRRRGWQRMRWLDDITDTMDMGLGGLWEFTGRSGVLWFTELQRVGYDWMTEMNWTELIRMLLEEINTWIGEQSKKNCRRQGWWAAPQLLMACTGQKTEEGWICSLAWVGTSISSCPQALDACGS